MSIYQTPTVEVDTKDLEALVMHSFWFALKNPCIMTVENSVELILKYWEDIDYLYHEQIVLAIEKMFILKTYDFTQSLKEWQKVLLNEGFNIGATADDGHFGKKTEQATMSWQLLKGVAIDGKVGPETIDAISNTNTNTADVPWQDPTKSLGERALYFSLSEKTKNVKEVPNGSNTSPEIKEYFKHATRIVKGQEKKLGLSAGNWCAVSSCYATKQALLKDEKMPHGYRAGVVELIQDSMKLGNWKSAKDIRDKKYIMQRGDLAIFDRSVPGKPNTSWWRHVARVETVVQKDNKTFRTLGGNEKNCYQFTERDITTKKFIGCIAYPQVIYDISNEPAPLIAPDPITKYPEGDAGWPHILKMIQNLVKHFNESFK